MIRLITLSICFLFILCCIFGPDNGDVDFSFSISVKDQDGYPVPNLDIFLINKIDNLLEINYSRSATTVVFRIEYTSFVELSIQDIERNHVDNLVYDELMAGRYSYSWYGENSQGSELENGVYFCTMTASENDTIYFEEELVMYMGSLSSGNRNGFTDSNGIFEYDQKKPFINLYDLDSLQIRDGEGYSYGSKAFSDTTVICLFSEDSNDYFQIKYVVVENGKNEIDIVWEPENFKESIKDFALPTSENLMEILLNDNQWYDTDLIGNYPNPFN
ncbi:MAG: hypothetical protein APR54_08695 [Candidatus Cloacimonas sp. SDB]|nr:MAG: hypothetical protein APR54_08695 [Candidatus Cloacimonas sp. SDB]